MKFSKQTIATAKRLYKTGLSAYAIGIKLGMSTKNVLWHCNPESRRKIKEDTYAWMKSHPEQWKKIMEKAGKKYRAKHGKK